MLIQPNLCPRPAKREVEETGPLTQGGSAAGGLRASRCRLGPADASAFDRVLNVAFGGVFGHLEWQLDERRAGVDSSAAGERLRRSRQHLVVEGVAAAPLDERGTCLDEQRQSFRRGRDRGSGKHQC